MKELEHLLENITYSQWIGPHSAKIASVEQDSRRVGLQSCFVAIRGALSDGHSYIARAVASGAVAVICEELPTVQEPKVSYIVVESSHKALGHIASAFYDHPSRSLKLVGITGTNGKTTTATLLYDLHRALGYSVGLLSTVVNRIDDERIASTHTTPDAVSLNALLAKMVERGCTYCFMEVSSHALVQGRVEGLSFAGALFSNITHDHLDYHHTFAEYIKAKKGLFDMLEKGAFALTNIDDRNGEVMLQNCRAQKYSYSLRSMTDYKAKIVEMHFDGMLLSIDDSEVWVGSTGRFNAYNMLAIYAVARLLGSAKDEVLCAMSALKSVSGRFERVDVGGDRVVIIDYAHTPDALESVILTIEDIRCGLGSLIVVCGCGGDRDKSKRPEMAAIATRYATTSIFTSDNPRSESAEQILLDMAAGVYSPASRYLKIVDRREAIATAMMLSAPGDVILIAGKGHEKYQIIGDEKIDFDDHAVVEEYKKILK